MAPRRGVKVNTFDYNKLTASDVLCPICRSILIEPITLPCHHGFCASCFDVTKGDTNLVCPLCRIRVGSWLRSALKSKKIVNEQFWKAIQDLFPLQVRTKLDILDEKQIKERVKMKEIYNNAKANNDNQTKVKRNMISTLKTSEYLDLDAIQAKTITQQLISNATPSIATGNSGKVGKVPNLVTLTKYDSNSDGSVILSNFATKEYTCRILCQNIAYEIKKPNREAQIHKKNRQIQEITECEDDRSNSIESECLYFKPIDYRHNPPSKGSNPVKVPTRRPLVSATVKIIAPCGRNTINIHPMQSAFARLFVTPVTNEEKLLDQLETKTEDDCKAVNLLKRKHLDNIDSKIQKRVKTNHRVLAKKETNNRMELRRSCDNRNSQLINTNVTIIKLHKNYESISDYKKKSLQEKADFELARKLQDFFNQTTYSTRSNAPKRNNRMYDRIKNN